MDAGEDKPRETSSHNAHHKDTGPTEPVISPEPVPQTQVANTQKKAWLRRLSQVAGIIVLCVISGFVGSYILLSTGIIKLDATQTITQNREKIVVQQGEIVTDVAKKVGPSVVSITTLDIAQNNSQLGTIEQGAASGIIISKDGYVLTNKHVVPEGTRSVTIIANNGTKYKDVSIVGRDPINDLAFLKINGVSNLTAATIGDSSKASVGQQVVAIGNALGQYQNSVTSGIISGMGRPVTASSSAGGSPTETLENLFQTDAAINPGNSGGPLLNLSGEVIGINTAIAQDAQGIGFSIPINDAKGLIDSVIKTGKVQRGLLGVRYVAINEQIAAQYNLPVQSGAYLTGDANNPAIVAGGAAQKAGLKSGDIITKVGGQAITPERSLIGLISQSNPGDTITISILRSGKTQDYKVTLQASL